MKQLLIQTGHYNFLLGPTASLEVSDDGLRITLRREDRKSTYALHEIDDSDPAQTVYFIGDEIEQVEGGFPIPAIQQIMTTLERQCQDAGIDRTAWAEGSDYIAHLDHLRTELRHKGVVPQR